MIVPGIPYSFKPPLKAGAKLQIRNLSGNIINTTLKGVEMISRGGSMDHAPFLVDDNVKKKDIEIGAELYYMSDDEKI